MTNILRTTLLAASIACTGFGSGAMAQATPTMGDIIVVGFNFCPRAYMDANGQLLAIAQYQSLFSLYGTTYGGDGRTTFALPDLRSRVAVSRGAGPGLPIYTQGERYGSETVTLNATNLATHNHVAAGTHEPPNEEAPAGNTLASFPAGNVYTPAAPDLPMANGMIANTGGNLPVNIEAPTLTLRYCVAVEGLYPSRS
jgi:microcystin-dependent protein